jgi:hypothetical protein
VFGFLDGIGQPAVAGFNINPLPGQAVINPGIILAGEPGDTVSRPTWAKDGSFLVFRQLKQLVPEFNNWLFANAPAMSGFTQQQSADLLGARMIGRWKSVSLPIFSRVIYSRTDSQSLRVHRWTLARWQIILLSLLTRLRITTLITPTPVSTLQRTRAIVRFPRTSGTYFSP